MLDVGLSPDTAGPRIVDSFRACLSSVLEIPLGEVPQREENLRAAVAQWRTWLAGRGVGLVPIANASRFQWPGYWIAVLAADARVQGTDGCADVRLAVRRRSEPTEFRAAGASSRRSPSRGGIRRRPLRPCIERQIHQGWRQRGRVEAVAIADHAEAPMQQMSVARAIPGRGLEGDRYANRAGTFTPRSGRGVGYDLTLIEAEVLDELTLIDGQGTWVCRGSTQHRHPRHRLERPCRTALQGGRCRMHRAPALSARCSLGATHPQGRTAQTDPPRRPPCRHPHSGPHHRRRRHRMPRTR